MMSGEFDYGGIFYPSPPFPDLTFAFFIIFFILLALLLINLLVGISVGEVTNFVELSKYKKTSMRLKFVLNIDEMLNAGIFAHFSFLNRYRYIGTIVQKEDPLKDNHTSKMWKQVIEKQIQEEKENEFEKLKDGLNEFERNLKKQIQEEKKKELEEFKREKKKELEELKEEKKKIQKENTKLLNKLKEENKKELDKLKEEKNKELDELKEEKKKEFVEFKAGLKEFEENIKAHFRSFTDNELQTEANRSRNFMVNLGIFEIQRISKINFYQLFNLDYSSIFFSS